MRAVPLLVVLTAALSGTALAAAAGPQALVLRSVDVPSGYVVDRADTGVESNAKLARGDRKTEQVVARLGRVTGYQAAWERERGFPKIVSRADVFRTEAGARAFVAMSDTSASTGGFKGLRRTAVRIGDGGFLVHGGPDGEMAWVVWRSGRISGSVAGWGITRAATMALARKQQRRIATHPGG